MPLLWCGLLLRVIITIQFLKWKLEPFYVAHFIVRRNHGWKVTLFHSSVANDIHRLSSICKWFVIQSAYQELIQTRHHAYTENGKFTMMARGKCQIIEICDINVWIWWCPDDGNFVKVSFVFEQFFFFHLTTLHIHIQTCICIGWRWWTSMQCFGNIISHLCLNTHNMNI